MTPKEWLQRNPNHKCTISASGDEVRATFHGGDGIDSRIVGKGETPESAMASGMEVRRKIVEALTINPAITADSTTEQQLALPLASTTP